MPVTCPSCGAHNISGSESCAVCGSALTPEVAQKAQAQKPHAPQEKPRAQEGIPYQKKPGVGEAGVPPQVYDKLGVPKGKGTQEAIPVKQIPPERKIVPPPPEIPSKPPGREVIPEKGEQKVGPFKPTQPLEELETEEKQTEAKVKEGEPQIPSAGQEPPAGQFFQPYPYQFPYPYTPYQPYYPPPYPYYYYPPWQPFPQNYYPHPYYPPGPIGYQWPRTQARQTRRINAWKVFLVAFVILIIIGGGVAGAIFLLSRKSASFNLGSETVTGEDIEFKNMRLTQKGNHITLTGTYDNNTNNAGKVLVIVQAQLDGTTEDLSYTISVEKKATKSFSKTLTSGRKIKSAILSSLVFERSYSLDNEGSYPWEKGNNLTPGNENLERTVPLPQENSYPETSSPSPQ